MNFWQSLLIIKLPSCSFLFLLIILDLTEQFIDLKYRIIFSNFIYRTRAIISRGLYIFYPISKDHFFVFKEVSSEKFCPYVWLVFKSGLWWRARLRYLKHFYGHFHRPYLGLAYSPLLSAKLNCSSEVTSSKTYLGWMSQKSKIIIIRGVLYSSKFFWPNQIILVLNSLCKVNENLRKI